MSSLLFWPEKRKNDKIDSDQKRAPPCISYIIGALCNIKRYRKTRLSKSARGIVNAAIGVKFVRWHKRYLLLGKSIEAKPSFHTFA